MSTDARSSWSDFVSRLVAHMLPVTYFLVTISFYLKTYDSAQIKITLTQIGCSLTAALWIVQLILEKRAPFRREDLVLAAPFLAMLASGLFSWGHSAFRGGSVEESVRRVLYCLMAFIAFSEFRGQDRQRRLLRWLLAAFGVVVFYGFIQYLDTRLFPPGVGMGVDPFIWRCAFGVRVFSSFGNPNFYGNFLVIVTPILLTMYLKNGGQVFRPYALLPFLVGTVVLADKVWLGSFGGVGGSDRTIVEAALLLSVLASAALIWWRTPSGSAAGMLLFFGAMFVTLYATETKGAWVGFVGAVVGTSILTGLYLAGEGGRRFTRRLLAAAAVTAVLGLGVVGHYARQRIQSVSFRVFTWISTFEMIKAHPWIGSGVGTFKWLYPAYRRPEIILLEGKSNTETDHAEQEYLEVWSDEGLLGIGLFLWLILTVSASGLGALKFLTAGRGPPAGGDRERVYGLVAFLGSWWGALLHWSMDVSVRFVSSGIYSFLLPAVVAGLSRPESAPVRQDAPSALDRPVRALAALFWTAVFLTLPRYYAAQPFWKQLFPGLALGAALWAAGELLERRLAPAAPPAPLSWGKRPSLLQAALCLLVLAGWGGLFNEFRGYFKGDLDHNVGIYFSKSGIWAKAPEFDGAVKGLPPEMREEYERTGGALEHYTEVARLNPSFPMANYFVGNVYNDWGSVHFSKFMEARGQGRAADAEAALSAARGSWDKAEEAYGRVKAFAPNYVQTHHQVGALFIKRMEMARSVGDGAKEREFGDLALKNFGLYNLLDPVFPPNYYRMAQVHMSRGDLDKAEEAFRGALTHNTANVVRRIYGDRNAETYVNLGRISLNRLERRAAAGEPKVDPADPVFQKAVESFTAALASVETAGDAPEMQRLRLDAHKGLGLLYLRAGDRPLASLHWGKVMALNPQDPDLLMVTGRR